LAQPEAFLHRFDEYLKEVNNPYGTVRIDQVPPPRLRILAPGSFGVIRKRQVEKGMSDSQLKFPHISEDRKFMSGLLVEREVFIK
jgi:GH3 auxin-responsive promoter